MPCHQFLMCRSVQVQRGATARGGGGEGRGEWRHLTTCKAPGGFVATARDNLNRRHSSKTVRKQLQRAWPPGLAPLCWWRRRPANSESRTADRAGQKRNHNESSVVAMERCGEMQEHTAIAKDLQFLETAGWRG